MSEWALALATALMGGLVGAWLTFFFGLRRDREERRRERVIAHLIEAYRNLENAAGRDFLSDQQKDRVESSVAAVFLLGSKEAAKEAKHLAEDTASGTGNMAGLLRIMRNELRRELGLERHDVDALFLRMWRDEANQKSK